MASDLRELISIIHISTELERIGDYAKVVARTVNELQNPPQIKATQSILRLGELGREQFADCMEAFLERDAAMARRVAKLDERMDRLWERIYGQILAETRVAPELVKESAGLIWIAHNFERMGDRITNICERIVYTATGEFEENVHLAQATTD
jgi:phosphate transport system protein